MPVIEVAGLRRSYRSRTGVLRRSSREVKAVRGIDFEVERGELFGLLGPNGAGKTTTIKMLITLLLPAAGSARSLGRDVVAEPREVRRRVGYVFGGDRGLYERLPGLDNLRYFCELYGVPPREQRRRLSPWILIPTFVVEPVFQVIFFAFVGRQAGVNNDRFFLIGNAVQFAAIPCLFAMSNTIGGERYAQTLELLLASPARRGPLFLGRALPVIVNGFGSSVIALVVGAAALRVGLPAGTWLPLTYGIEAARKVAGGDPLSAVASLVGREAAVGLIYVVIGMALLRFFEAGSRRRATLHIA